MNVPIPVLAIPQLNRRDLLIRLIEAIDYPVAKLVIIQNGPDSEIPIPLNVASVNRYTKAVVMEVIHIKHPNAGCAASWNEVIKLFPEPWWFFMANDIQPQPGDLQKMADAAWIAHNSFCAFMANWGHGAFIVTKAGIDLVGLHDENIYPAYLEDSDWMTRLKLSGGKYMDVPGVKMIHGDGHLTGSCTINSDPRLAEKNGRSHQGNFEYYVRKWGGRNEEETFKTPFNDPNWPLWAWKFDCEQRAKQQW